MLLKGTTRLLPSYLGLDALLHEAVGAHAVGVQARLLLANEVDSLEHLLVLFFDFLLLANLL